VVCLAPFSAYRAFHFEHHRRSHAPGDSEPVFVVRNHLEQAVVVPTAVLGLCAILWWRFGQQVAGRGPAWTGLARRRGLELATGLAAAAALAGLVGAGVVWGWHLPLLLWGAPVGVYLVLAGVISSTEHYECDYGPGSDFATSRTILTGPLVRLCIWNANFHTAHHLVPAVPGRNLGRLHELIADRYEHVEPTYRAYHAGMWKRINRGELPEQPPWVSEEPPAPDRAPHAVAEPLPGSPEMAGPAGRSRPTPT
jgi:fatty acid desaturase